MNTSPLLLLKHSLTLSLFLTTYDKIFFFLVYQQEVEGTDWKGTFLNLECHRIPF
jgi:hypothetical protein